MAVVGSEIFYDCPHEDEIQGQHFRDWCCLQQHGHCDESHGCTWLYTCGDRTCSHIVVHIACDCRDCDGFQNLVNELNIAYPVVLDCCILSVPKLTCIYTVVFDCSVLSVPK